MRHVPRQPDDAVNVSKTHPLSEAAFLVAGLGIIFMIIALTIVFFVELSIRYVSAEDEAALFERWIPQDLTTVDESDERQVATQQIVDRLARHWPDSPYKFRVEIDTSDAANALALPGGLIIITEGLLKQVESENELAFVLGHELGHFNNRDHLRSLGRGLMLSIALTTLSGGDVNNIGITITDLTLRSFGRAQETAADRYALLLVQNEYGHIGSAWKLFERWEKNEAKVLAGITTYLSTHPDPSERIQDLKSFADDKGWPENGVLQPLAWQVR